MLPAGRHRQVSRSRVRSFVCTRSVRSGGCDGITSFLCMPCELSGLWARGAYAQLTYVVELTAPVKSTIPMRSVVVSASRRLACRVETRALKQGKASARLGSVGAQHSPHTTPHAAEHQQRREGFRLPTKLIHMYVTCSSHRLGSRHNRRRVLCTRGLFRSLKLVVSITKV